MSKVSITALFKKANIEHNQELELGETVWQSNSLVD